MTFLVTMKKKQSLLRQNKFINLSFNFLITFAPAMPFINNAGVRTIHLVNIRMQTETSAWRNCP